MQYIAILITCYNRKEKTLSCLTTLFNCVVPDGYKFDVYLVDDGSTDGTSNAIKERFPQINIVQGTGNLFWTRGMHLAWKTAAKVKDYNFYLWLNDDTILYDYCLGELLECNRLSRENCIISGLIEDESKKIIYGGTDNLKKMLQATDNLQQIARMNGNVVLVPQVVVAIIGILDPVLWHDLGDVDYGLRATKADIKVYSTRKAIASGYSNNFCRVRKWNTNIIKRFRQLYSPLGSPPHINFYFRHKHFGIVNACCYWLYIHFINFLPDRIVTIIWGNVYHDK
jgi:GT2 family glycosyltransferase